jgi:hypothetical protein
MKNFNTIQKLWIRNRIQQIVWQEILPCPQSPPAVASLALGYASAASCNSSGYFNQSTGDMPSYEDYSNPQTYQQC